MFSNCVLSDSDRLPQRDEASQGRGGQVIVINPAKELGLVNFRVPSDIRSLLFGSEIASLYVQPHIGGDIALLTGVAKLLLERGQTDGAFIADATEGFAAFRRQVEATTWEEIERGSGGAAAPQEKCRSDARRYLVRLFAPGGFHHWPKADARDLLAARILGAEDGTGRRLGRRFAGIREVIYDAVELA